MKQDQIRDKYWYNRIGITPDFLTVTKDLLVRDDAYSFQSVLLRGIEWNLLCLQIAFFALFDLILNNVYISLMIVYFLYRLLLLIRQALMNRNLTKKTLLDKRFLN